MRLHVLVLIRVFERIAHGIVGTDTRCRTYVIAAVTPMTGRFKRRIVHAIPFGVLQTFERGIHFGGGQFTASRGVVVPGVKQEFLLVRVRLDIRQQHP